MVDGPGPPVPRCQCIRFIPLIPDGRTGRIACAWDRQTSCSLNWSPQCFSHMRSRKMNITSITTVKKEFLAYIHVLNMPYVPCRYATSASYPGSPKHPASAGQRGDRCGAAAWGYRPTAVGSAGQRWGHTSSAQHALSCARCRRRQAGASPCPAGPVRA